MATSNIKSITKTQNTWNGQSGTMYDYDVEMEDGSRGIASSTSPDAPPYEVGDSVEYTMSTNSYGTKLRIKKEGSYSGGGYKKDPELQKRIENSWAIQTAVQIKGPQQVDEQYLESLRELSCVLLDLRDNLK